jgi:colicin import membrane protein
MGIPVATALGRRDRFWPAVLASAALHVALAAWGITRRPAAEIDLDQKPIVARLVRLGEKRPEEFLPRKEAPPPAPAPPAPAAAPVLPHAQPAKPAAPAPAAPPPKPAAGSTGRSGTTLASVLSKVQRDADQERRWGSPDGDPAGDSETGSEGDRYIALVERAIHANYRAPSTISERDRLHLEATVAVWIEPDGRIARWRQERASGNSGFDAAVERALKLAPRLPPPPENLRRTGITLIFRARDT